MRQYRLIAPSKPNYEKYLAYLREKKSPAIILRDIMKAEDYKDILFLIFPEKPGSKGGRPREYSAGLLLKVFVFQTMENLSAEKIQREIRGNKEVRSFMGLDLEGLDAPDVNIISNFSTNLD